MVILVADLMNTYVTDPGKIVIKGLTDVGKYN